MQSTIVSPNDVDPIGFRKDGRPIFPIMGGAPDGDEGASGSLLDGDDEESEDESREDESSDDDTEDDPNDPSKWDAERTKEEIRKRNVENSKLRKRTKDAEDKAAKWDEYQKSLLSKEERLAAEAAESGTTASKLADENNRLRVRLETGLTERQVARLVGSNYDELLEDAEAFKADLPPEKEAPAPRKTPSGSKLKGGLNPADDEDAEDNPLKLADRAIERRPTFF